ncbi:MAG: two-component regulator propeller domain-containing protein, partial [Thermoanaerobaculia bacterium]|nr:two-component regulator propeller domain-containing protein [Thermoanaerobaculia bacterium]
MIGFLVLVASPALGGLDGEWRHLDLDDGLAHTSVYDLALDSRGFLLIASEGGLQRWDGYELTPLHRDPDGTRRLLSDNVGHLYRDPAEPRRIWIGTWGGGLSRLDIVTGELRSWVHDPGDETSLSDDRIQGILRDSGGRLWVATYRGLNRMTDDGAGFRRYSVADGLPHDRIWTLDEDRRGRLWLGTGDGLARLAPDIGEIREWDSGVLGHPEVRHLQVLSTGEVWIGTRGGLHRHLPGTESFPRIPFPSERPGERRQSVNFIREDAEGRVWIGTHRNGLLLWRPESRDFRAFRHRADDA